MARTLQDLTDEGFTFISEVDSWDAIDDNGRVRFVKRWGWCPDLQCKRGCGGGKIKDNAVCHGYISEEAVKRAVLNHMLRSTAPVHEEENRLPRDEAASQIDEAWDEIYLVEVETYTPEEVEAWHEDNKQAAADKNAKRKQHDTSAGGGGSQKAFSKAASPPPSRRASSSAGPQAQPHLLSLTQPAPSLAIALAGTPQGMQAMSQFGLRSQAAASAAMSSTDLAAKSALLRQAWFSHICVHVRT